ncbi:MAG: NGG1p interacting factor NIF3 [Pseudomonadota bacterium]
MLKLTVYVPASHLDAVKDAIFAAGAGRVGDYDRCSWQVLGEGQFRALPGAQPFIGMVGSLEQVAEYRVETVLPRAALAAVVTALKMAHPYETPAFDLTVLLNTD